MDSNGVSEQPEKMGNSNGVSEQPEKMGDSNNVSEQPENMDVNSDSDPKNMETDEFAGPNPMISEEEDRIQAARNMKKIKENVTFKESYWKKNSRLYDPNFVICELKKSKDGINRAYNELVVNIARFNSKLFQEKNNTMEAFLNKNSPWGYNFYHLNTNLMMAMEEMENLNARIGDFQVRLVREELRRVGPLSRKLTTIRFYLGSGHVVAPVAATLGLEHTAATLAELEDKIRSTMAERKERIEEARRCGFKSLKEWNSVYSDGGDLRGDLDEIGALAREYGVSVSAEIAGLMFVVAGRGEEEGYAPAGERHRRNFKFAVRKVVENEGLERLDVVRNVVAVVEFSERELVRIGRLGEASLEGESEGDTGEDDHGQEEAMRVLFDSFLGQVMWLESVYSEPIKVAETDEKGMRRYLGSLRDCVKLSREGMVLVSSVKGKLRRRLLARDQPETDSGEVDPVEAGFLRAMEMKIEEIWGKK